MKKNRPTPALIALVTAVPLAVSAPPAVVEAQTPEAPAARQVERPLHPFRGEAGHLGVSVRPLNTDLRRHFGAPTDRGVLVASVEAGTPAAEAGLEVGDVLVAVDGREIGSVAALHRAVRARPGERVEIDLYRDGERRSLTATLGERAGHHRHEDPEEWAEHWEEWGEGWAEWGEEWGEDWAEWGESFGERWAELGAEIGERWGERGAEWGAIGAEIGVRIGEAFADMDWHEMDRALEESMRALEEIDWDEIGDEIDRAMDEVDEALEEAFEERDRPRDPS